MSDRSHLADWFERRKVGWNCATMPKRYGVERVWTGSRDGATIQGLLEQEQERSEWLKGRI